MERLIFTGNIVNGIGKHSQLTVPGRDKLPFSPKDWPLVLAAGSLNVHITKYPDSFRQRGIGLSFDALDSGYFEPAFEIPQSLMHNNKLIPTRSRPRRGIGQVWNASIAANDRKADCWVLRRIASTLTQHMELIAGHSLRDGLHAPSTKTGQR
jgi:hypothetical protein